MSKPGSMAAVGLSWEDALRRCPADVDVACHNSADLVTISGDKASVAKFVDQLASEGIFCRMVDSKGFAYHSSHMRAVKKLMLEKTEKVSTDNRIEKIALIIM